MSNTPQKFCFRYDVSDEAKEALEIVKSKFNRSYYVGLKDVYYYNDADKNTSFLDWDYTLVPPSEFIRLMKGEDEKWKVGDECYVEDQHDRYEICFITEDSVCLLKHLNTDKHYKVEDVDLLRPIRKSLREDVSDVIYQSLRDSGLEKKLYKAEYPDQSVYPDLNTTADRIIQLLKERGVEV